MVYNYTVAIEEKSKFSLRHYNSPWKFIFLVSVSKVGEKDDCDLQDYLVVEWCPKCAPVAA